ncbi:hypothetical protein HYDPIDRAFT_106950 [Hydnomerulius pinastri MD-312]|nr:hypothetical protein HYDPIDRAFT_106950 [Hydnomerulius pinastri MD-312]
MSPETSSKPSRPAKSTTRSSIRQSLNFTSVGKALADVINKEPRDRESTAEKALKKSKESSSRRLSAIALMNSTAIPQAGATAHKSKSPTPAHGKEDGSPTNKTITRSTRRQSGLLKQATSSADEQGIKATEAHVTSPVARRSSTLRPKTASGTVSSALPKYRPRSALIEPAKKPASPARTGTRRRLSTSEEDDGDLRDSPKGKGTLRSPEGKVGRPISPLPHRALAVKINLPSPTVPSTPSKSKTTQSTPAKSKTSPARASSLRPTKTVKTAATSSPTRAAVTRPPSSASSSSSLTQPSPSTTSSFKNAFGFGRSKTSNQAPSPLRGPVRPPPESPLAHHSRHGSAISLGGNDTPTKPPRLVEGNSEDSIDVDDVELLLAPVASLAVPTPAIPRIHATRYQPTESQLQTPSRPSNLLPTRANLSYLSPLPSASESSPALRPKGRGYEQNRGSIFSWEQMAADSSQILAQDEVDSMLADITAPFTPGGPSPNVSAIGLEIPESPSLSAMPSPAGYGSISQVLLPDVTPSPAVYHLAPVFETSTELPPPMDSGTVTLLRLQVAQAENTAKERLSRLQELEEQLHAAKQSRVREAEELAKQISFLEEQLHASVDARERMDEERSAFTASLQDELRHADARCEQAAEAAFNEGQEKARSSWNTTLAAVHQRWEVSCAAKEAAFIWSSVKDQAEDERNNLQTCRQTLNVFLAVLDHSQSRMQDLLA